MRRLVLACLALALLPACGREPQPIEPTSNLPTTHAANYHAPTGTPTPPALPKIARRKDATGAANFVLYWVDVSNYAAVTGDTKLLRTISDPRCDGCNRYIHLYEKTYAAGGYIEGGTDHLDAISTELGTSETFVRARVNSTHGQFKASRKAEAEKTPAESTTIVFAVRQSVRGWSMTQIGLDR